MEFSFWWVEGEKCPIPAGPCPQWSRVSEETARPPNHGDDREDVGGLQDPPCNQWWDGSHGTRELQACPCHLPRTAKDGPTKEHNQTTHSSSSTPAETAHSSMPQDKPPAQQRCQMHACGKIGHYQSKFRSTKKKQLTTGPLDPSTTEDPGPSRSRSTMLGPMTTPIITKWGWQPWM